MQSFPDESHSRPASRVGNPQLAIKNLRETAESTTDGGGGAYRGGSPRHHAPTRDAGLSSHGRLRHAGAVVTSILTFVFATLEIDQLAAFAILAASLCSAI